MERKAQLKQHAEEKAADKALVKRQFMLLFKKPDGSIASIGPFQRRMTAIIQYRKRYKLEYGVECPADKFGLGDSCD